MSTRLLSLISLMQPTTERGKRNSIMGWGPESSTASFLNLKLQRGGGERWVAEVLLLCPFDSCA